MEHLSGKKMKTDEHDCFMKFRKNKKLARTLNASSEKIDKGYEQMNAIFLELDIADPSKRRCFSKAVCHTKEYPDDTSTALGSIFYNGMQALYRYTSKPATDCLPNDAREREALKKLLIFMSEDPPSELLNPCDFFKRKDDVSWMVILAQHLFSRLSLGSQYRIDHNYPGKKKLKMGHKYICACNNKEEIQGSFEDTSFGCPDGWHGSVDMLIGDDVPVFVTCAVGENDKVQEEEDSSSGVSDGSDSSVEVEIVEHFDINQNMQLASQCVVFSFLQSKKDTSLKNHLIPLIGICKTRVKVLFYDCKQDILLRTASLPLHGKQGNLCPKVTILLWLVLNYKLFCTGVPDGIEHHKAKFTDYVKDKMAHYQGDVVSKIDLKAEVVEEGDDDGWASYPGQTPKPTFPVYLYETDSNSDCEKPL